MYCAGSCICALQDSTKGTCSTTCVCVFALAERDKQRGCAQRCKSHMLLCPAPSFTSPLEKGAYTHTHTHTHTAPMRDCSTPSSHDVAHAYMGCVYMNLCMCDAYMNVLHTHTHTHTYTYTHTLCMLVCRHLTTYVQKKAQAQTHTHIHTHTHIYIMETMAYCFTPSPKDAHAYIRY